MKGATSFSSQENVPYEIFVIRNPTEKFFPEQFFNPAVFLIILLSMLSQHKLFFS
jgi:hypothetical protein